MSDLSVIHPISFFKDNIIQNADIGNPEVYPILLEIQHMSTKDKVHTTVYIEDLLRDFVINNVSNLANTFIIKLLEDYISKDEIAYLVDFYDSFDIKTYLFNTITKSVLGTKDEISICNIIESNIIFVINQFIQFYSIYKIVYTNEGVDLYKLLYKETYGKDPEKEIKTQDKYVFCCSILNSMLDNMVSAINECCIALRIPILNIKTLSKEVIK